MLHSLVTTLSGPSCPNTKWPQSCPLAGVCIPTVLGNFQLKTHWGLWDSSFFQSVSFYLHTIIVPSPPHPCATLKGEFSLSSPVQNALPTTHQGSTAFYLRRFDMLCFCPSKHCPFSLQNLQISTMPSSPFTSAEPPLTKLQLVMATPISEVILYFPQLNEIPILT